MSFNDIYCELLTQSNAHLLNDAISRLDESDDIEIDIERLGSFLEHPQNLAFIAKCNDEVCGLLYGYTLMSLTAAPQLFIYSVDVFRRYQNIGIGSTFFQYVVDYSKDKGYSECFVITDKGNKRACRIYEKAGGKNDFDDEIVYVIKHQ